MPIEGGWGGGGGGDLGGGGGRSRQLVGGGGGEINHPQAQRAARLVGPERCRDGGPLRIEHDIVPLVARRPACRHMERVRLRCVADETAHSRTLSLAGESVQTDRPPARLVTNKEGLLSAC
jgi:hypothetical protein